MPRVVASIEARMQSTRLPGKMLMNIEGKPTLTRLYERLKRSKKLDDIILATSTQAADDVLEEWAINHGVHCYRGSESDVLGRVLQAHEKMDSDIVVEITGDCPLIDPEIVDLGIETFLENDCDIVTNVRKQQYPLGIDVQVFKTKHLREICTTIHDPVVREHVSLFFYENPNIYRIIHLIAPETLKKPGIRLVLDYEEDLRLITALYRRLEPLHGDCFSVTEVIDLLDKEPTLFDINRFCEETVIR